MSKAVTVGVSGISGFVGLWCAAQLLKGGYKVHGTVRSLKKEADIKKALGNAEIEQELIDSQLKLFEADVLNDAGWSEALEGCTYMLHVASPFPRTQPKDENDLIKPAVEGTKRALKFAREAGVKRIVVTSSMAAVKSGLPSQPTPYNESNWTDTTASGINAYEKSKTLAEKAAWEFMDREGGNMSLAVVNPSLVLGPALSTDFGTSIGLIADIAKGKIPLTPRVPITMVDVRDVAELHVKAMESDAAAGQRFCCSWSEPILLKDVVLEVKRYLGELNEKRRAAKIKGPFIVPDFPIHAAAYLITEAKTLSWMINQRGSISYDNAKTKLGWQPRDNSASIRGTVDSLITLGVI